MTQQEYDDLQDTVPLCPVVSARDLADQSDRTLLWGYTTDRRSWHVFLREGVIELYVYGRGWMGEDLPPDHMGDAAWPMEMLVPNKRLYPEACDREFCELLMRYGIHLPFTTFNAAREPKQFYGDVPPLEVTA
ncbi:hypothetical protein [Methylobacterium fujisawaense]|uniref:hypothetical protein n=1 Tax=Methylobacterium fujisawaense TaxID=107400 RepID=UPI00313E1D04